MTDSLCKAEYRECEVPLHELLEGVPESARLVIDSEDGMSTSYIPVGYLCKRAAKALRQALAQPGQGYALIHKDVLRAWGKLDEIESACCYPVSKEKEIAGLALAQPEQKPVAIVNEGMGGIEWLSKPLPDDTPLYTAPQKREWVGLTGDEQDAIVRMANDSLDAICLTEDKLKEKNT